MCILPQKKWKTVHMYSFITSPINEKRYSSPYPRFFYPGTDLLLLFTSLFLKNGFIAAYYCIFQFRCFLLPVLKHFAFNTFLCMMGFKSSLLLVAFYLSLMFLVLFPLLFCLLKICIVYYLMLLFFAIGCLIYFLKYFSVPLGFTMYLSIYPTAYYTTFHMM